MPEVVLVSLDVRDWLEVKQVSTRFKTVSPQEDNLTFTTLILGIASAVDRMISCAPEDVRKLTPI